MKVRSPMHSIDVRGKFGASLIFSIWRGMNYLKGLTIPVNPQTARQLLVRGYFTNATRAWEGLDDTERAGWEAFAEAHPKTDVFGSSFKASGFNYFVGLSSVLLDIGGSIVDTAPEDPAPGTLLGFGIAGGGAGAIDVSWTAPGAAYKVEIELAGPVSAGRRIPKGAMRHNQYLAGTETEVSISGLTVGLKYGIGARVVRIADGQKSGRVSDSMVAPAA